ncbi:DAB2 family protein [Megaselia abdita]
MLKNVRNSITSSSLNTSGQQQQNSNHHQQPPNNAQAIKNRNDPGRFFGDGVIFKAKLIGVLEVGEARGDRMCQEALQDLKTAIRAAGEHKQRITIHVTIDGLRLRDEKTSDCLYHHPVHKISFIAQDMTDSRAFGYIFGSPDSGHRFFGIKTDKAASQVVLAMRDLFQVVFELKKKEIELARQQIQSKTTLHDILPLTLNIKGSMNNGSITTLTSSKINNSEGAKAKTSPESVADLVDLEQELNCLQRGINQMERITPSEPTAGPNKIFTEDDPFGDSFTNVVPSAYSILPPPESSSNRSSRHSKPVKPPDTIPTLSNLLTSAPINNSTSSDNWLAELSQADVFDTSAAASALHNASLSIAITNSTSLGTTSLTYSATSSPRLTTSGGGFDDFSLESATNISQSAITKDNDDVGDLQDLDPLGTGKIKPYVDKKYFFHEIKNPPKKVLKELTSKDPSATDTLQPDSLVEMLEGNNGTTTPKAPLASSDSYESNQSNEVQQQPTNASNQQQSTTTSDNTEDSSGLSSVMMARDTDPFSPTRKKSDPFQDGNEIFGKMDSTFQFDFEKAKEAAEEGAYNGPLQVSLPPETPPLTTTTSMYGPQNIRLNRSGGIKQNTVDVISTISSKTMPHLFGQKFSKRDSPSINMRRLQESDSLSETEGAPEPPPRPDAIAQPPPLPPKKQFTDIIIRPRTTSISSSTSSTTVVIQPPPSTLSRYSEIMALSRRPVDSSSTTSSGSGGGNVGAPPIPLPSRKVSRTDYSYPGPNRPRKPGCDEDNYLAPVSGGAAVPTLLPPPKQSKGRVGRRYESYENRETNLSRSGSMKSGGSNSTQEDPIIPDITLSQLLTLGVDDLAKKLGVPATKLNTMTLVELTKYLAEYIEKSSRSSRLSPQPPPIPPPQHQQHSPRMRPVPQTHFQQHLPLHTVQFKANFDDFNNTFQTTFDAKFDDNFGEESSTPFVANFSQFNEEPSKPTFSTPIVPSADRYAVFREIIDLELQSCPNDPTSSDEGYPPQIGESQIEEEEQKIPKIDTKITEAISNAKDRYAALRDIILVEDLFDKPKTSPHSMLRDEEERDDSTHEKSIETGTGTAADDESSPEEAHDIMDEEAGTIPSIQTSMKDKFLTVTDDVEIDELMNRAISNLSLDSRDHLSPSNIAKSPQAVSPSLIQKSKSPLSTIQIHKFNDVSTSPIPLQKLVTVDDKAIPKSKSPIQSNIITSLIESTTPNKLTDGSMSDIVCNSSPDVEQEKDVIEEVNESWACFDKQIEQTEKEIKILEKQELEQNKESPCSSDGPKDWKGNKRWPKGQTSSSSRDLSPWDDEANDYKKRIPPNDRHGFYARNSKRLNSCDDDYDYEEEMALRRERKIKGGMSRSRDNFDFEPPSWYSGSGHHSWSPQDYEEARARAFERGGYDRTTYGPPFYDKRDKMSSHSFYDRRGYDKRKYYRDRDYSGRTPTSNYDFESYNESYDKMSSKGRRDYENVYDEEFRGYGKSRPEYFYEGKSFDRESNESFESVGRRRRSFGSGDVYGSLESREDFRDRYTGEKARSLRKGMNKIRSGVSCEFDQDSENDIHVRRGMAPLSLDSRSLQRPVSGSRIRKSSGSSPWDVAEADAHTPKNWKRPASATESERRRNLGQTPTGSDGEKDKRFRKKQRYRSKDPSDSRQTRSHRDDYDDYMECEDYQQPIDEDKFERLNRRKHEMHQRMGEIERRKKVSKYKYEDEDEMDEDYDDPPMSRKDNSDYYMDKPRYASQQKFDAFDFEAYNDGSPSKPTSSTIRTSSGKFSYQEQGFESDFNASPPSQVVSQPPTAPSTAASTKSSFRFSNDFSSLEKDRSNFENPSTQKLRFDDKVTVSKFENDHHFEDDFSKNSEFEQNKNPNRANSKFSKQEIKKSESVNIFAKKSDDPFEDDDFFKSSATPTSASSHSAVTFANSDLGNGCRRRPSVNKSNVSMIQEEQQWEDNFAKFDENM